MQIDLGCLAAPLTSQLAGAVDAKLLEQFEMDKAVIDRCYMMGYIPALPTANARKKLMAAILKAAAKGE